MPTRAPGLHTDLKYVTLFVLYTFPSSQCYYLSILDAFACTQLHKLTISTHTIL